MADKTPGEMALARAWSYLSQANNDWSKNWAPAMPHNALSNIWEAMGAANVARILGADPKKVDEFEKKWWELMDAMDKAGLTVTIKPKPKESDLTP